MLNFSKKRHRFLSKVLLAFLGLAYFTAFSQMNISVFLKGYALIIPLQILTLLYVFYIKTKQSSPSENS